MAAPVKTDLRGPWKVEPLLTPEYGQHHRIVDADGVVIASVYEGEGVAQAAADAPEMRELLRDLYNFHEHGTTARDFGDPDEPESDPWPDLAARLRALLQRARMY